MKTSLDHAHDAVAPPPLNRRQALARGGAASAALLLAVQTRRLLGADDASAATQCATLTPSKTIGPYFVEEKLNRSDIRIDPTTGNASSGIPLTLAFTLLDESANCAPVVGAQVDVWHADASGKYSDESVEGTSGKKYLRGYQVTDSAGKVNFTTIYPGWYSGRTVHIHIRVRVFDSSGKAKYDFTSQVFFDDATTDQAYASPPYSSRGSRDTRNSADSIYGSDGATCLLALTGNASSGYAGSFTFGLSGTGSTSSSSSSSSSSSGSTSSGSTSTGSSSSGSTTTGGTTTTGDSSTTTADTSVSVALPLAKVVRTATGHRQLRLRVRTKEATDLTIRLRRGSKVLGRKTIRGLAAGTHAYAIPVGDKYAAGRTTLVVTVEDEAGNTKSLTRILQLPAS